MTGVELGGAAPAGLLERHQELATAQSWLAGVRAGRGRMMLIEAPAGLGKSSLIEEIGRVASDELLVLSAAGREVEQDLGWGVARSLFEPWLLRVSPDERADLLSGPGASASLLFAAEGDTSGMSASEVSFGILHGLYWLTARAAENRPALLIVDDAHWADEPSLRLLSYLLGRIHDQPIGLLVAARTGEPDRTGLLTQLTGERAVTILEPAPLSAPSVRALIKTRMPDADAAFARRCWELTAGNPLGVRELLLAIADLPPGTTRPDLDALADRAARSLSRSVLRRLAALGADARALADAVSVFEVRVELQWAAALAGLEPTAALAAADELARVDILTGESQCRCPLLKHSTPRIRRERDGRLRRWSRPCCLPCHPRALRVGCSIGRGSLRGAEGGLSARRWSVRQSLGQPEAEANMQREGDGPGVRKVGLTARRAGDTSRLGGLTHIG